MEYHYGDNDAKVGVEPETIRGTIQRECRVAEHDLLLLNRKRSPQLKTSLKFSSRK